MPTELSIGNLSKETGVKTVTIRFYEKIGVLATPHRNAANYRVYTQQHLRQLHFVRRCRDLGFSLDQILDFLRLTSGNHSSCVEICRIAERHLDDVEARLADLKRLASELRRITSSCNGARPVSECRIIEALYREKASAKPRRSEGGSVRGAAGRLRTASTAE